MIALTRLNGEILHLNVFQIEAMDAIPETRITLASGRMVYVRERPDEVMVRTRAWWRGMVQGHEGEGT
jgi:flagellar protein FlbD